ncbi:hypothetical protein POM88_031480 [Heracleum sosnowskyi]|uniref:Uncharacterized protein n=1 Tax=Heracleum sosnowskyi TaxID=360622 RepID=A0AAD8MJP4_9APIA|nr:hypothetical protein POM88_031480 [Heracleum sosnowskyi]
MHNNRVRQGNISKGIRKIIGFQKNFGFIHKNAFSRPSGLRFVTSQSLRLLKSNQVDRLCKLRGGFKSDAESYFVASSFDNSVGDLKDCGRVEGIKKEAGNCDGSDTNTVYGHGNGDSRGNHQGGGGNGGTGSGGQDESADWEELRWFCWQILKAWKYYNKLAKLRSYVVAGVGNIQVKIEGYRKEIVEPNFDGLEELLRGILEFKNVTLILFLGIAEYTLKNVCIS